MLSISQFTEKFLEQNLSKFLYHIEVTVWFVEDPAFSSCSLTSSFLPLFHPAAALWPFFYLPLFPFHSLFQPRFVAFLLLGSLPFSSFHPCYSPWYFLPLPRFFSFPFFFLFSRLPLISPPLTPCSSLSYILPRLLPLLPSPPPLSSWSCISAYNKSRFVYPQYFENV